MFLSNPPTTLNNKNPRQKLQPYRAACPPLFTELAELIGEVGRRPGGVGKVLRVESIVLRDIFHSSLTALR